MSDVPLVTVSGPSDPTLPDDPAARKAAMQEALAMLSRGLQGAIAVSGLETLPRPTFLREGSPPQVAPAEAGSQGAPATSPPATETTTTTAPSAPKPTAVSAATATANQAAQPNADGPRFPLTAAIGALGATSASPTGVMATAGGRNDGNADGNADGTADGTADPRAAIAALLADPRPAALRLKVLQDDIIGDCRRCKLHRGRNKLVFGVGNPEADIVFVGEGPGADEDREGIPFVGRAGQLLTKMIAAMGYHRDDVYIANVVKCRPPKNRDPEADEVAGCEGFLRAQLGLLQPKVVVGLGKYACHTLLHTTTPISRLRGTWQAYEGVPFMPTYHPSYLLREEADPKKVRKREAWNDLQLVMERFGRGPR